MTRWAACLACSMCVLLAACSASSAHTGRGRRGGSTPGARGNVGTLVTGGSAATPDYQIQIVALIDPYSGSPSPAQPPPGTRDVLIALQITHLTTPAEIVSPSAFALSTTDQRGYAPAPIVTADDLHAASLGRNQTVAGNVVFTIPGGASLRTLSFDAGFGRPPLVFTAP